MKSIVRLPDEERAVCQEVVQRLKGASEKVRRAQLQLLTADADGACWPDSKIVEAFDRRVQTLESLRRRLAAEGFERAPERRPRAPHQTEAPAPRDPVMKSG